MKAKQWVGPAYWNTMGDESAYCPKFIGPNTVLYGGGVQESLQSLQNYIYYGGTGVDVATNAD